jgi:SET domain-containing protein
MSAGGLSEGEHRLLVKTTIAPSPIHGMGLFADQCIPQGTRIWESTPGFDLKLSGAFLENAAEPLRSWLHTHTYCSRQSHQYILCSDDARFFNHSGTPNTESREVAGEDEVITVAKRDIQHGEERWSCTAPFHR